MSHPNILPLIGVILSKELAVVSPWMENGNVIDYLRENHEANPVKLLEESVLGLQYLHEIGLVHGDLQGRHILVGEDGHARLANVGHASFVREGESNLGPASSTKGPENLRYYPPELLTDTPTSIHATKQGDIYSMGMTIYEVLADKKPFHEYSSWVVVLQIVKGARPKKPIFDISRGYTEQLWDLTTACWGGDPAERPTASNLHGLLGNAVLQWKPRKHEPLGVDEKDIHPTPTPSQTAWQTNHPPHPTIDVGSYAQAWRRLISGAVPDNELASLIKTIFSSERVVSMVDCLQSSDAQTFIDIIDKALKTPHLAPEIQRECLNSLYITCAGHSLLPRSLQIDLPNGPTGVPLCHGGFGDVWKCELREQQIAVKVPKANASRDLQKVTRRFFKEAITWKALNHGNVLPLRGVAVLETTVLENRFKFAMVSEWMPNGNINQFVETHRDANRFELLEGVARGLIYMHEQGMVHGDLKGVNILIDKAGHARLADFGLLTIISETIDLATSSSSFMQGGTYRWMGPELFPAGKFDPEHNSPTKSSDCYALGMVIYEVLSGKVPFYDCNHRVVVANVLEGKRPGRPEETWFTNDVWSMLEGCWKPTPYDRPRIRDVLQCLLKASRSWTPPL